MKPARTTAVSALVLSASWLMAASAAAQTSTVLQTPLNDADCSLINQATSLSQVPPLQPAPPTNLHISSSQCSVAGTRTVTIHEQTLVPGGPITPPRIQNGSYSVQFAGSLQEDGIRVAFGSTGGSVALIGGTASVNLSTSYDAFIDDAFIDSNNLSSGQHPYFQRYANFDSAVSSIDVNVDGGLVVLDGRTYLVDLAAPSATTLINGNSVSVLGRYNSSDSHGALVFGRITGTATLVENAGVTPIGNGIGGYFSPFALRYDTTVVETTRLDENGLTTPTVSVTNGINMNGSGINNLAPGVAPGDAVNVAQLQSAVAAGNSAISSRVDVLEDSLQTIDSRLAALDDRVNSSAAVATALGGAAFLPDMRFNLSANVATYGGAHAGAVQFGALVNRHVALTAGVASGFNKRGKTAARVGFSVGW